MKAHGPLRSGWGPTILDFGCTTCIGNSGPLPPDIGQAVADGGLAVASVLSGNRNFEGRINPDVRMNYLMSPPLVVAYAIAGTVDIDLTTEPLGTASDGADVYLRDIWPSREDVDADVRIDTDMELHYYRHGGILPYVLRSLSRG